MTNSSDNLYQSIHMYFYISPSYPFKFRLICQRTAYATHCNESSFLFHSSRLRGSWFVRTFTEIHMIRRFCRCPTTQIRIIVWLITEINGFRVLETSTGMVICPQWGQEQITCTIHLAVINLASNNSIFGMRTPNTTRMHLSSGSSQDISCAWNPIILLKRWKTMRNCN